jgi:hypothetical protein
MVSGAAWTVSFSAVDTLPARLFIAFRVAHAGPVTVSSWRSLDMPTIAPRTFLSIGHDGTVVVGWQWREDAEGLRLDDVVRLHSARA